MTGTPQPPDPMTGFRGVMAATLVLEAIVAALALLVVANQYGGLNTLLGLMVGLAIVALLATCGLLRFSWSVLVVFGVQVLLVACVFIAIPVGFVGLLFAAIWGYLLWLRRDVARRMMGQRLPGPPSSGQS